MDRRRISFLLTLYLFVIEQLSGHLSNGQLANNIIGAEIDLNNSIPGIPGKDYMILSEIPETDFDCTDKTEGGLYADVALGCQGFHICKTNDRHRRVKHSFLCPNGTIFNQELFICDWWFNFDCSFAESFYYKNEEIPGRNNSSLEATKSVPRSKNPPRTPKKSSRFRFKSAPPLAISTIFHTNSDPNSIEPIQAIVSSLPLRLDLEKTSKNLFSLPITTSNFFNQDNIIQSTESPLQSSKNETRIFKVFNALQPNSSIAISPKEISSNTFLHSKNLIQTPPLTIVKSLPDSRPSFELPLNFEPLRPTLSVKKLPPSHERENSPFVHGKYQFQNTKPKSSFLIPANTLANINQSEQDISNIQANSQKEFQKSPIVTNIYHPINFPITHPPKPVPIPLDHKFYTYKIIPKILSTINVTESKIKRPNTTHNLGHPRISTFLPTLNHEVPHLFPATKTHSGPSSALIPELSHPSSETEANHFNISESNVHQLPSRFPHFPVYEEPHSGTLSGYNKFPHFPRKLKKSPKSLKFDSKIPHFYDHSDLKLETSHVNHAPDAFGLPINNGSPQNHRKFDHETISTNHKIPQVPFHSIFRPAVQQSKPNYQSIQVSPVFESHHEVSHTSSPPKLNFSANPTESKFGHENALANHNVPLESPHYKFGPTVPPRNQDYPNTQVHPIFEPHTSIDAPKQRKVIPTINHHYFSALPVIESRIRPPTYAPSYTSAPPLPIRRSYYRELKPSARHYPVHSESGISQTIISPPHVKVKELPPLRSQIHHSHHQSIPHPQVKDLPVSRHSVEKENHHPTPIVNYLIKELPPSKSQELHAKPSEFLHPIRSFDTSDYGPLFRT